MTSTSRVVGDTFYFGEAELSAIVQRAIRYYRFHNGNNKPRMVVIPYIAQVEGVVVSYGDTEPTVEPGAGKPGDILSPDGSKEQESTTTDNTAG